MLTFLSRNLFDHVGAADGTAIAERWDTIDDLVREGGCPFFISGDSHSFHYAVAGAKYDAWMLPIHLLCTGASATGLANPHSRSGYGRLLRQTIQPSRACPALMRYRFCCSSARSISNSSITIDASGTPDSPLTWTTTGHSATAPWHDISSLYPNCSPRRTGGAFSSSPCSRPRFRMRLGRRGYVNADIAHRETAASVEELRSGIRGIEVASLRQRTAIHAYYNDILRAACDRYGFGFVDGMTSFLGADGVIDPRFVIPEAGGAEHHLDGRQTYHAISKLIWYA